MRSRTSSVLALVCLAALLAACGSADRPDLSATATSDAVESAAVTTSVLAHVADDPVMALAVRPGDDDAVYVAVRTGSVVRIALPAQGQAQGLVGPPVLDFHEEVSLGAERGMLGLAFSPDGAHLYTSYTDLAGDSAIDEYPVSGEGDATTVDRGGRRRVLSVDRTEDFHNGGDIAFGPDGFLYVAMGDGGGAATGADNGQPLSTLLGKILRIDPTGTASYGVPEDNPFVGVAGARPEIWIRGVRNPWRMSFDRETGDLWIADVGEHTVEEVDHLPAGEDGRGAGRGANLGWALMEGDRPYEGGAEPADHVPPLSTYTHDEGGCAVIGGYVNRGPDLPVAAGAYLFLDRCLRHLRALELRGDEVVRELDLGEVPDGAVSFGEDAEGRLYLLQQSGDVLRLAATPD